MSVLYNSQTEFLKTRTCVRVRIAFRMRRSTRAVY